jgi:hypothetical protein
MEELILKFKLKKLFHLDYYQMLLLKYFLFAFMNLPLENSTSL